MTPTQRRFLVAGAGYLGLRAATSWQQQGHDVFAITRTGERAEELKRLHLSPLLLNLGQPPDHAVLPEVDTVLWSVGFERTQDTRREIVWIDGLNWLIRHLPRPPKRFIYISSSSVYGAGDGGTVDEAAILDPVTEGGRCCVEAELLIQNAFQDAMPGTQPVILRMAGIYGPDRLLRKVTDLRNGQALPGQPDRWLNLIHVDDAVRMVHWADSVHKVPEVVNVVNAGTLTRGEYYAALSQLVGAPPPVFSTDHARARGGNRRIVSRYQGNQEMPEFHFDDVHAGLRSAVDNSTNL